MTETQVVINKWGEILVKTIKNKLIAGNKVASGNLINSINYKYGYVNGAYTMQITGAPYLINVDRGRKKQPAGARLPNITAIIAWIKNKHIKIGYNKHMKPTGAQARVGQKTLIARGKKAPTEQQILGMAIAIGKNINKRGIKPFPILNLGKTITQSPKFKQEIKAAIIKDLQKQIKLP